MTQPNALAGRTAFITGASGAIAVACATQLARDGATLALMGRDLGRLEKVRATLREGVPGVRVEVFAGEPANEADVKAAITGAHAIGGRLDIIVATAGGGAFKPLLMLTPDELRADFDGNVVASFLVMRHGAPLMQPGGSIVCISSTTATMPFAYLASYHVAKNGVEALVRAAAEELGPAGIRVNAVRPGLTRAHATGFMLDTPSVRDACLAEYPLGRLGEPADIANAVRYLAGPEASWVTGQSFAVDGGNELRKNPDLTFMVEQVYGPEAVAALRKGQVP